MMLRFSYSSYGFQEIATPFIALMVIRQLDAATYESKLRSSVGTARFQDNPIRSMLFSKCEQMRDKH